MWDKIKFVLKIILRIIIEFLDKPTPKEPIQPIEDDKKKVDSVIDYQKKQNVLLENIQFEGVISRDFILASCETFEVRNVSITDKSTDLGAHRDAFQITPYLGDGYTAGKIKQIKATDVIIQAKQSNLQGLFVGDGYVERLTLENLNIDLKSAHSVTITGALSGSIVNCVTSTPIQLLPLRLFGGDANGRAIWIIQDSKILYGKVSSDLISDVSDLRDKPRKGWNVYNVDSKAIIDKYDDPFQPMQNRREIFLKEATKSGARVEIK